MDAQALQTLQQFVSFIKNIDKHAEIIGQIQSATANQQKVLDLLTQGKTLAEFQTQLSTTKDRLDFERKEFDASCQVQIDSLASRAKVLDAFESALNDQATNQKASQALLNEKFQTLDQRVADLDKKEADLNARDQVNTKTAQTLASKLALIAQVGA